MPTAASSTTTADRRRVLLLTGVAVAAPGCATAAGAALGAQSAVLASAVDPHPAWLAEAWRLRDLINDRSQLRCAAEKDVAFSEMLRLEDMIATTPASTLLGVHAQLELIHECHFGGSQIGDAEEKALLSAMDALARLGERA